MCVILPRALAKINCGHFDNIYFLKNTHRKTSYVCNNISSYFKHYRKHVVIHSEVSAYVLN
jgi:hypothetical protein